MTPERRAEIERALGAFNDAWRDVDIRSTGTFTPAFADAHTYLRELLDENARLAEELQKLTDLKVKIFDFKFAPKDNR